MNTQKKWISVLKKSFDLNKQFKETQGDTAQKIKNTHFDWFLKKGFPSTSALDWKFYTQKKWMNFCFTPTIPDSLKKPIPTKQYKGCNIYYHNGSLLKATSLPKGLKLYNLKSLPSGHPIDKWLKKEILQKKQTDGFYHLAYAFSSAFSILHVEENIKEPVHLHFSFSNNSDEPALWNLTSFVYLSPGADLTVKENYLTDQNSLVNSSVTVKCLEKSRLHWLKTNEIKDNSFLMSQFLCDMDNKSHLTKLNVHFGEGFSRDADTIYQNKNTNSLLLNLSLLKGSGFRDQRFITRLLQEKGQCRQFSRGILDNASKILFHGRIHIKDQAKGANAEQSAKNLSLSPQAESYTYPELEIDCGEVKAQHGATGGAMNKEELFYLQSRGLDKKSALKFLILGYIEEILNQFPKKELVKSLDLQTKLTNFTFCS